MTLRDQAIADVELTLGAAVHFAQPFVMTDPSGKVSGTLYGAAGDIGVAVDAQTGLVVTGRQASLSCSMASLVAEGFTPALPEGVPTGTTPPWRVTVAGINYKVKQTRPDRTLGIVTMVLEYFG